MAASDIYSRQELSDAQAIAMFRAAAHDANRLVRQTRVLVSETYRLLELIARIERACIEQPTSDRTMPLYPADRSDLGKLPTSARGT
jgi:hypothetical protein